MILVFVEAGDDVELLAILSQHLRKTKCTLIEARDGEEALAMARKHQPDLMILDVMMPGLSGWEVAKRVRDDSALANTGIIMLTAIGEALTTSGVEDEVVRARLLAMGCGLAQGYLFSRPVPEPDMSSMLARGRRWGPITPP